ncbi:hypothetical protein HXX76_011903 [Chlamydomonas incerta]|uniref:Uncharacterized protein n=1 Tax=Chlamydomonas incerta TaxID=51695 RepID=A0A835STX9_CHLIN|nr:hypothetical protein HXX76_011903 [Chlamydomonas incerta]|eukprot:KAG2428224.1 hypothetical protein HXX76_011903 [Chlamydomonas incerta]
MTSTQLVWLDDALARALDVPSGSGSGIHHSRHACGGGGRLSFGAGAAAHGAASSAHTQATAQPPVPPLVLQGYDAEGSIHGKPQLDSLISFTLAGVDGAAAAAFCPGAAHRLAVNFTDARLAMLTSGRDVSFGQQHAAGACPNRADLGGSRSGGAATGFVVPFRVACSASGDLTFRVTSASRRLPNAWKHNSVTLPVSAACAAAECTVEL